VTNALADFYRGTTVLITGHTGFKGSWLATWLHHLGANVVGYALEPPTEPSHFVACGVGKRIVHVVGDIRDHVRLEQALRDHRPQVIFHLAAEAIVRLSYSRPRLTFDVNVMGTVNVLEAARQADGLKALVVVSSDKCYGNDGQDRAHRETDPVGAGDPYSTSKACAELVTAVYQQRLHLWDKSPRLPVASARAGNVIGGGDWAQDRLIPDVARAIAAGVDVVVRSPHAIRPWQHVLEPLSGYLWLAARLAADPERYASAWNFGPPPDAGQTVVEVLRKLLARWSPSTTRLVIRDDRSGVEASRLQIDASRAATELGWRPVWDIDRTLDETVAWYRGFLASPHTDHWQASLDQIGAYTENALGSGLPWAATEARA
jgi:CDP-glucose 4,6-dehydratase